MSHLPHLHHNLFGENCDSLSSAIGMVDAHTTVPLTEPGAKLIIFIMVVRIYSRCWLGYAFLSGYST